ncbi:hypothetical protein [Caldisericum sp.]|uniref:hypothetical protein n=1 Tax=Caldisericum sp. TaxID=2499687 RepID=UPI003D0B032F
MVLEKIKNAIEIMKDIQKDVPEKLKLPCEQIIVDLEEMAKIISIKPRVQNEISMAQNQPQQNQKNLLSNKNMLSNIEKEQIDDDEIEPKQKIKSPTSQSFTPNKYRDRLFTNRKNEVNDDEETEF